MSAVEPWLDAPACPKCHLPVGTTKHAFRPTDGPCNVVQCSACGEAWRSDEDYARAKKADAAWVAKEDADELAWKLAEKGAKDRAAAREMFRGAGLAIPAWAQEPEPPKRRPT